MRMFNEIKKIIHESSYNNGMDDNDVDDDDNVSSVPRKPTRRRAVALRARNISGSVVKNRIRNATTNSYNLGNAAALASMFTGPLGLYSHQDIANSVNNKINR